MTRAEYWQRLCAENPKLRTAKAIRFTPEQLRKFTDKIWDAAHGEGVSDGALAQFFSGFSGNGKGGKQQ